MQGDGEPGLQQSGEGNGHHEEPSGGHRRAAEEEDEAGGRAGSQLTAAAEVKALHRLWTLHSCSRDPSPPLVMGVELLFVLGSDIHPPVAVSPHKEVEGAKPSGITAVEGDRHRGGGALFKSHFLGTSACI